MRDIKTNEETFCNEISNEKKTKETLPWPLLLQGGEKVLTDDAPGKGVCPAVVSAFTKRVDDNDTVN